MDTLSGIDKDTAGLQQHYWGQLRQSGTLSNCSSTIGDYGHTIGDYVDSTRTGQNCARAADDYKTSQDEFEIHDGHILFKFKETVDTTRHSRFKEDVRDTDMHVLRISRRELAGNHRAIEADVALSNEWAGVI